MSAPLKYFRVLRNVTYVTKTRLPVERSSYLNRYFCNNSDDRPAQKGDVSALNLAKPGKAKKKTSFKRSQLRDDSDLDEDLVEAAHRVAKQMKGDQMRVASDLLNKLKEHQTFTNAHKDGKPSNGGIGSVLKGIKTSNERENLSSLTQQQRRQNEVRRGRAGGQPGRGQDESGTTSMQRQRDRKEMPDNVVYPKLFDGEGLGIFSRHVSESVQITETESKSLFDELQGEEQQRLMSHIPTNAFEEEIYLTKQGKMWKFPIDNEEGMEEEQNVGFYEHVFFDDLMAHFPETGPVRHFMDLVVVGLSKNPYITAKDKRDHILWFKDYFADKYERIEELSEVASKN